MSQPLNYRQEPKNIKEYNRLHDHSHDVRDASSLLREVRVASAVRDRREKENQEYFEAV